MKFTPWQSTSNRVGAILFQFPHHHTMRVRSGRLHRGLSYTYRAGFVARYAAWPACPLETTEALEQLRVLWHGEKIAVLEADEAPPAGVDTPADLERVRKYFLAADEHK